MSRYTHPLARFGFSIRAQRADQGGRCGKERPAEMGAEDDTAGAREEASSRREIFLVVNVKGGWEILREYLNDWTIKRFSLSYAARDTVDMPIPPEAAFDRYFRGLTLKQRKNYEGKFDLDQLESGPLKVLLLGLQHALSVELANERTVPEHRDHPPFHVDYIRSTQANALAFKYEGYSFVGLTIPLVEMAAKLCVRLCNSLDLLDALGLSLTPEMSKALGEVLLKILLYFVVSHEYTHIVHGHPLSEAMDSEPINEVQEDDRVGSLDDQTLEADADSYAIYHIMENWIRGAERSSTTSSLGLDAASSSDQDALLFACIVVAIGAYFVLRPVGVPGLKCASGKERHWTRRAYGTRQEVSA